MSKKTVGEKEEMNKYKQKKWEKIYDNNKEMNDRKNKE